MTFISETDYVNKAEMKVACFILGLQLCVLSFFIVLPQSFFAFDISSSPFTTNSWFILFLFSGGALWVGALLEISHLRVWGLALSQLIWFMLFGLWADTGVFSPVPFFLILNGFGCMWLLAMVVSESVKDELKLRRKGDLRTRKEDTTWP